ncbi:hypothetical protein [Desulfoplanes sp.]
MPDQDTTVSSHTNNLPAKVEETGLALRESKELLQKSFAKAMLTNLAIMACSGVFATRSARLFWEKRGKQWSKDLKEFTGKAYRAIKQDAFGSDETIETLQFLDALPPSDAPQLPPE